MIRRFFRRVRLWWTLLQASIPVSFWKVMTMTSTKIQEALDKLNNELPPLVAAKADAVADCTEAEIAVTDADQAVREAQADLQIAENELSVARDNLAAADANYDSKISEVIALLTAAQGE